jgi:HPt (histidine-containing phosphotransfer) domain-containing protein
MTPEDGLNTASAIAGVGGNEAYYRQMLARFIDAHQDSSLDVQAALRAGDTEKAAGYVHALVSAAGFIGAARLCFAAHALELSLKQTNRRDIETLAAELQRSLQQTLVEARVFLGESG